MWITIRIFRRGNESLFVIISELTDNIRFQAYIISLGKNYENLIFFQAIIGLRLLIYCG